jgi:hypothetical protein
VVGGRLEGLDFGIDQRHGRSSMVGWFRTGGHVAPQLPISEID